MYCHISKSICSRLMDNIQWLVVSASGGAPVLFLPDCRKEVLLLLAKFLLAGEVVAGAGELEEVQGALAHLQVHVESQVQPSLAWINLHT